MLEEVGGALGEGGVAEGASTVCWSEGLVVRRVGVVTFEGQRVKLW